MSSITAARRKALGLDDGALYACALDPLRRRLPPLDIQGSGYRYAARLDRIDDASRVLLFEQWRGRIQVTGEPVIVLAARDELLIYGSDDMRSLAELRNMARSIAAESAYGLGRQLFVCRKARLMAYLD